MSLNSRDRRHRHERRLSTVADVASVPANIEGGELNEFGAVLLELLEARGLDVYDLAERISTMLGAPEISGEDLLDAMTADGEE